MSGRSAAGAEDEAEDLVPGHRLAVLLAAGLAGGRPPAAALRRGEFFLFFFLLLALGFWPSVGVRCGRAPYICVYGIWLGTAAP